MTFRFQILFLFVGSVVVVVGCELCFFLPLFWLFFWGNLGRIWGWKLLDVSGMYFFCFFFFGRKLVVFLDLLLLIMRGIFCDFWLFFADF